MAAKPVAESLAQNIGTPSQCAPARMGFDPAADKFPGPFTGRLGTQGPEVGQPGECVQGRRRLAAFGQPGPWTPGKGDALPGNGQLALENGGADSGISGPGIGGRATQLVRDPAFQQQSIERRAVEEMTNGPPAARRRQASGDVMKAGVPPHLSRTRKRLCSRVSGWYPDLLFPDSSYPPPGHRFRFP